MKNEEAREILKHERERIEFTRGEDYSGVEALTMAIQALKQQPKTGQWKWCYAIPGSLYCSICGFSKDSHDQRTYDYCPGCGHKMLPPFKESSEED